MPLKSSPTPPTHAVHITVNKHCSSYYLYCFCVLFWQGSFGESLKLECDKPTWGGGEGGGGLYFGLLVLKPHWQDCFVCLFDREEKSTWCELTLVFPVWKTKMLRGDHPSASSLRFPTSLCLAFRWQWLIVKRLTSHSFHLSGSAQSTSGLGVWNPTVNGPCITLPHYHLFFNHMIQTWQRMLPPTPPKKRQSQVNRKKCPTICVSCTKLFV